MPMQPQAPTPSAVSTGVTETPKCCKTIRSPTEITVIFVALRRRNRGFTSNHIRHKFVTKPDAILAAASETVVLNSPIRPSCSHNPRRRDTFAPAIPKYSPAYGTPKHHIPLHTRQEYVIPLPLCAFRDMAHSPERNSLNHKRNEFSAHDALTQSQ